MPEMPQSSGSTHSTYTSATTGTSGTASRTRTGTTARTSASEARRHLCSARCHPSNITPSGSITSTNCQRSCSADRANDRVAQLENPLSKVAFARRGGARMGDGTHVRTPFQRSGGDHRSVAHRENPPKCAFRNLRRRSARPRS